MLLVASSLQVQPESPAVATTVAIRSDSPAQAAAALFGESEAACAFAPAGDLIWLNPAASRIVAELGGSGQLRRPPGPVQPQGSSAVLLRIFSACQTATRRRLHFRIEGGLRVLAIQAGALAVPGAVVRLCRLDLDTEAPAIDVRELQSAFNLTGRELEVAVEATRSDSLRAVSQSLGMSSGTLRVHLRHIFQKTGVRSQVELLNLVYRFRL